MSWHVSMQLVLGSLELEVDIHGGSESVALIGPNGSGKTTLLKTIAGGFTPDAGRFELGDKVLFDSHLQIDLVPEQREVGYVPQGYSLFPHLSVVDNVAFGLSAQHSRAERRSLALEKLHEMDCAELADRRPLTLSGGEQQRIALARTLITKPTLLLLDEPLSALDVSARRSLRGYLAQHLARHAIPTIVVTHDIRDVAALGARMIVLDKGRVVQSGSVDELRSHPANDFVAEFCHTQMLEKQSSD